MHDDVADAFGELLIEVRREAGFSQEELANRSGLDRTTISQMERGLSSPRLDSVIRLAGALGLATSDLLPAIQWRPPASDPAPRGVFVRE